MSRVRAPIVRIADHGDATTIVGPRGALRFDGDSAQLLRAVLEIHARPATREQVFAELAERSGGEVPAKPVDDLLALLAREDVLVDASPSAELPLHGARPFGRRVVLAISGAIAAVDAPLLVRGLHSLGCDVRVALTKTAQRFVAVPGLEALTHHQVWRGLWQRTERTPVPHINLAEWAELVIVWPASATTIARIANGDCSDLVSAIATATRVPVVIAPSMNDAMLASPAVQDNLDRLRAHGRWIVHGTLGVEVAHKPEDRRPMFGPAAPPSAIVDIARHLLVDIVPRPRLPESAAAWERLWSTTPIDHLPWTQDPIDASLTATLDRLASGEHRKHLLDFGTGSGVVAIEAARRGFIVTASDVSTTALEIARTAASGLPILFTLDDAIESGTDMLTGLASWHVIVDRGLLHCLPIERRPSYAAIVASRTHAGGTLLIVAHQTAELATHPITGDELRALLPAFELVAATPTTLSRGPAQLFELRRRSTQG